MHLVPSPAAQPTRHGERLSGLDGLRGLAIVLVLYHHAPLLLGHGDHRDGPLWAWSRGGWIGVDLFFVLSGFLITGLLLKERGQPGALQRFWVRRALRIFPLAYAYLAVLALLAMTPGFGAYRDGTSLLCSAAYLQNFHIGAHGWTNACYALLWSLCVEEHFYLLWPLAALWLRRATLCRLLGGVIVLTPLLRWWLLPLHGPIGNYVHTACRWDSLSVGALLALAWHSPLQASLVRAARWLAVPALLLLAGLLAWQVEPADAASPPWFHWLGFSAIALAASQLCTLALAPPRAIAAVLCHPVLTNLGRVSYGLYVWHVLLAQLTQRLWQLLQVSPPLLVRASVWLCLLAGVAAASYHWFEAPLLRLRDRLPWLAPGAPAAAPTPALPARSWLPLRALRGNRRRSS